MSKHTPGPWHVKNNNAVQGKTLTIVAESVKGGIHIGTMFPFEEDEEQANARLIAAAPDMLAELKSILSVLEARKIGLHRQETIRQVIAKVTL